jgi:TrmH family RNA methyltransferase
LQARIVLVKPLYGENVGLVARACANFGVKELALVRPECDFLGEKAVSRAMHGRQVLEKAKICDSLEQALEGCYYSVATSARKGRERKAMPLPELVKRFGKSRAKLGFVFGPEPSGLSNAEIGQCDFVACIPASKPYPVLNLSHAVAVVLSRFFEAPETGKVFDARPETRKRLLRFFKEDLELVPGIDNRPRVFASFKALTSRSRLSEKECRALVAFFGKAGKKLGKGKA